MGFIWIVWVVILLVLYHKFFRVLYFDLGQALWKEFLTAGFIAIFMTAITLYLWWLTAIVIIIGGVVLKKKVSSNVPFVVAVILAIVIAVMGMSSNAKSRSNTTMADAKEVIIINEFEGCL